MGDLESLATSVAFAASEALKSEGLRDFEVVVNAAWRDSDGNEFAMGTAASPRLPMLADSLKQSAEEITDA